MRIIEDCDGLDRGELLAEVKERRALIGKMVGRLYPGIVAAEIGKLEELIWPARLTGGAADVRQVTPRALPLLLLSARRPRCR